MKKCPNCGSENTGFLIPSGFSALKWRGCRDCDAEWPDNVDDPKRYMILPGQDSTPTTKTEMGK